MRFHVVAMSLVLAIPALADCPVASDLDTGIRFTVDGTDTEEYRQSGPGVVESLYISADGATSRSLLAQGIYLIELVDMVDGSPDQDTRTTYAFPGRAEDLALPAPGQQVAYDLVMNSLGDLKQERQTYDFGQAAVINFGACEYQMIPIEIRYDPDESGSVDLLYYLPELGFSYFAGTDHADGSDRYMYSNIEVIE
ncbi:hypothetical protein [Antarctobacter heliothermus]|uniref:Uncharacterized protein n=1 Tax=Antarctobacter heliothermus TaxID=74033 RepID=A0A239DRD7_9RHOB|nr:hypothetical protein [Antarctobacter heliothermus]SNS34302.1 hypothetical protein SAMN04488078_101190 [Antarctobacter heliothermus]